MLRAARNLSQVKLAEQSGVSLATIKRIESPQGHRCHKNQAERLAVFFGKSIEYLTRDIVEKIIDIGGEIELHLDKFVDPDAFRQATSEVENLLRLRAVLLARSK